MHAIKSAEHGYRIIAPQSTVAPNDVFRYAHDPAGHTSITGIDKLPALPVFVSGGRTRLPGIVIGTATKLFFVTVVLLAGKKSPTVHVLANVGFKGPVLICA